MDDLEASQVGVESWDSKHFELTNMSHLYRSIMIYLDPLTWRFYL